MPIKVSVVVPVYNAAGSIEKCLESLRAQTLEDIEIILVDDGSSDDSGKICDAAARSDSRVRVLHLPNGGPANARNRGMAAAEGDYIGFADADDRAEPEMYAQLYETASAYDADMAICDFLAERGGAARHVSVLPGKGGVFGREKIQESILPYFFGYSDRELADYKRYCPFADTASYVWLGLYRTRMIREHEVSFPSEKRYYTEDNLFNLLAVSQCDRLAYLPRALYHYVETGGSFTARYTENYFDMRLRKYEYLRGLIGQNGLSVSFRRRLQNKICAESISVIDYYVAAGEPSWPQKLAAIRRIARNGMVSRALSEARLEILPFSARKIFLELLRKKWAVALLVLSGGYVGAIKTAGRLRLRR